MKLLKLPTYLYKYINWENEFHRNILCKNEIFFSSITKFNDPFDSSVPLRYDLGTDEQIFNLFCEAIQRDNPGIQKKSVEYRAHNHMQSMKRNQSFDNIISFRELIKSMYGIFCTSQIFDSILMWSHYSNSHKGLCLRINCEKFKSFIETECINDGNVIVWDKVEYSEKYPILNPFEIKNDYDYNIKPLIIKSSAWEYEEEVRFILFDFVNKIFVLPEGVIDAVYLGWKIPAEWMDEVISICSLKKIKVFKMIPKEFSFSLGYFEQFNFSN